MTEPNIVRTRKQCTDAGNPGSWSGPLPNHYSKYLHIFALRCVKIYIYCITIYVQCVEIDVVQFNKDPKYGQVIQVHMHKKCVAMHCNQYEPHCDLSIVRHD